MASLCELGMDDVGVLMPIINTNPHLLQVSILTKNNATASLTFRKVLNPAKMLPPIQVEYFLSGGAKILMRISLTANFCSSVKRRSPKPFVNVLPPESTMLL